MLFLYVRGIRSSTTTVVPEAARRFTVSPPMPPDPPVITTISFDQSNEAFVPWFNALIFRALFNV